MRQANEFKLNYLQLYAEVNQIFQGKEKEAFYMTAKEK